MLQVLKDKPGESRQWVRDFGFAYDTDPGGDTAALSNEAVAKFSCGVHISCTEQGFNGTCEAYVRCSGTLPQCAQCCLPLHALAVPSLQIEMTTCKSRQPQTVRHMSCNAASGSYFFLFLFDSFSCREDPCVVRSSRWGACHMQHVGYMIGNPILKGAVPVDFDFREAVGGFVQ